MILLLATITEAKAVPEPTCTPGLVISDTIPGPGSAEVPVDVRLAVTFSDGCGGSQAWSGGLTLAEDGTEVGATAGADAPADTHLLELFPDADFAPDTAYVLLLTPDFGEAVEVGFSTGTETVAGLTGAPTVTTQSARFVRDPKGDDTLSVTILVDQATDPDALSVLQVRDGDTDRAIHSFVAPPTGEVERTVDWTVTSAPDEVCPQVRQIDGAGVATEWSAADCVEVSGCGCTTTSPVTGLAGVVFGLMLALRRRA